MNACSFYFSSNSNWAADMILCKKEDKNMCVFYAKIIFSETNIASL